MSLLKLQLLREAAANLQTEAEEAYQRMVRASRGVRSKPSAVDAQRYGRLSSLALKIRDEVTREERDR